MNSLLKNQIQKYLSSELAGNKNLEQFFNAVNDSYESFDEQFAKQKNAMNLFSQELFKATNHLKEANKQEEVIKKLKRVFETLKFNELPEEKNTNITELDGLKLVDVIDSQAKEIAKINNQKETLLNEIAHQNEELSDYAHMVSHDLRSSLRSIHYLTTSLKEDYDNIFDSNGKNNLKLIRNNVKKMDLLINGILDYSTITKNEDKFYNVDLNNLINDILNIIAIPDNIKINIYANLPIVKGDKYLLQQLFRNLIINAIKHNDKDQGIIDIGFKNTDGFWQFFIRDNGKGIDEIYFKKIFQTFQKLDNNPEATGMGLSIVKKIITVFGGKIWLESTVGISTTFYFTLKKNHMEQPNLNYIQSMSRGDKAFEKKILDIIKKEFPEEKQNYLTNFKNKDYKLIAENVHKIKHKISILGLDKSYAIAGEFENNLLEGEITLHKEFESILNNITSYLKNA